MVLTCLRQVFTDWPIEMSTSCRVCSVGWEAPVREGQAITDALIEAIAVTPLQQP